MDRDKKYLDEEVASLIASITIAFASGKDVSDKLYESLFRLQTEGADVAGLTNQDKDRITSSRISLEYQKFLLRRARGLRGRLPISYNRDGVAETSSFWDIHKEYQAALKAIALHRKSYQSYGDLESKVGIIFAIINRRLTAEINASVDEPVLKRAH